MLTVVILLLLFLFQQLGTSRVSFSFSPIMLVWFASISMIGLYNIIVYYPPVLKAVSPHYIYYYFARNGAAGWEQLGAIILCITGEPDYDIISTCSKICFIVQILWKKLTKWITNLKFVLLNLVLNLKLAQNLY
jgi:hypothetical protein